MSVKLKNIIEKIKPSGFIGNQETVIHGLGQLEDESSPDALYWCSDKNMEKLIQLKSGTVILSEKAHEKISGGGSPLPFNCILTDNPRRYFMHVVKEFFAPAVPMGIISKSAVVHPSVKYNKEKVFIGENVVIEENAEIGDHVIILHNTVIHWGTKIKSGCRIGSNCTIGGAGFGYEKDENGNYEQIIHTGIVELEENVEIGNNVAIDRAVIGKTLLGRNVKVDNLVHIAHGVKIGENSLIIANAMIAGSVNIGKNVWVAPSASVLQKVNVGDDATVGIASNVLKDVEKGSVVAGNPARKIR